MAKILSLTARLGFDGTGFSRGMAGAKKEAESLKDTLASAFARIGAAAAAYKALETMRDVARYASEISDTASQFEMTTDAFQEMSYWAETNAGSIDALKASFDALDKSRKAALEEGDPRKIEAFGNFGIAPNEIATLSTRAMYQRINEYAMQRGQTGSKSDLMEIFGKSASKMAFAFQNSLEEAAKSARDLGYIMHTETALRLAELNDSFNVLKTTVLSSLAPAVLGLVDGINYAINIFKGMRKGAEQGGTQYEQNYASAYLAKEREQRAEMARLNNLGRLADVNKKPESFFDWASMVREGVGNKARGLFGYAKEFSGVNQLEKVIQGNLAGIAGIGVNMGLGVQDVVSEEDRKKYARIKAMKESQAVLASSGLETPWQTAVKAAKLEPQKPSSLLNGSISSPMLKSSIESDAFAKIGGFVGASGSVNHLKESADASKALLALARGQGIKTVIKE